jgi:L-malate glycosyltransferase
VSVIDVAGRAIPVAMVLTSFEPGGTERQMIELIRRLDPERWTVHIASFRAHGPWFGRAAEAAASVTCFPVESLRAPATLRHVWAFARWCRARRIAVVHTAEMAANLFGQPSAALGGVPVRIANRREINPDKTSVEIGAQRASYAFAHKVVANSHAAADRLTLERVPANKIAVVPNGIDVQQYQPRSARDVLRKVVVVSNLRPQKGHDVLVDAMPIVLRRFPDARVEVIGSGSELEPLQVRAGAHGVSHAIAFRGHREDVSACLCANDIFVLPSRSEAFPNAVLEAMASGMPIVASRVGGIPELIEDGHTGFLVPAGDPLALADRLCRFMANPPFAARLGENARAGAEARYSFDRMVAAFERIYLTELTRRGLVSGRQPQLAAS